MKRSQVYVLVGIAMVVMAGCLYDVDLLGTAIEIGAGGMILIIAGPLLADM